MALKVCNQTFITSNRRFVRKGEIYDDGPGPVADHPAFFSPMTTNDLGRYVEDTSAAPGQKRLTRFADTPAPTPPPVADPPTERADRPNKGESTKIWLAWALAAGYPVTEDMTRSEIIEIVER